MKANRKIFGVCITAVIAIILIAVLLACYFLIDIFRVRETFGDTTSNGQPVAVQQTKNIPVKFSALQLATAASDGEYYSAYINQDLNLDSDEEWLTPQKTAIEGLPMLTNLDYKQLQKELTEFVEFQNKNAFEVQEFSVLYIDADMVEQMLTNTEELFMGYRVSDLLNLVDEDTYLSFDEEGNLRTEAIFNAKNFFKNIAKGFGILLIGALLAPITGGASFSVALAVGTTVAVGVATVVAGVSLVTNTVQGLKEGRDFKDSIKNAGIRALNAFGQGFVIGACIGSAVANIIGPGCLINCFPANTPVTTANGNVAIQDIKVGDKVLTYEYETGRAIEKQVAKTTVGYATKFVELELSNGEVLQPTINHPFYVNENWTVAENIQEKDILTTVSGEKVYVNSVKHFEKEPTLTYNLVIEDDSSHTYFVGDSKVLVHNGPACYGLIIKNLAQIANDVKNVAVSFAIIATATALLETISQQIGTVEYVTPQTKTITWKNENTAVRTRVDEKGQQLPETRIFNIAYVSKATDTLVILPIKLNYSEALLVLKGAGLIVDSFLESVQSNNQNLIDRAIDSIDINDIKGKDNLIFGVYTSEILNAQLLANALNWRGLPEIHFFRNKTAYWHYHDRTHLLHIWFGSQYIKGDIV